MPPSLGMGSAARGICLSVKALKGKQQGLKEVDDLSSCQPPAKKEKSIAASLKKAAVKYLSQKLTQKRISHVRPRHFLTGLNNAGSHSSTTAAHKPPVGTGRRSWSKSHTSQESSLAGKSSAAESCEDSCRGNKNGNDHCETRLKKSWSKVKHWFRAGSASPAVVLAGASPAHASVESASGRSHEKGHSSPEGPDSRGYEGNNGGDGGNGSQGGGGGDGPGGETGGEGGFEGDGNVDGVADAPSVDVSSEEDGEEEEGESLGEPWLRPLRQHFFASLGSQVKTVLTKEVSRDKSKGATAQEEKEKTSPAEPRPALGQPNKSMIGMDSTFDWLAGLLHSLVAERVGGQGKSCVAAVEAALHDQATLIAETAKQVVEILTEQEGDGAFAQRSEVQALKRLQRETFNELLRVKDRLDKLEHHTGLRKIKLLGDSLAVMKTRMRGDVGVGLAMVPVEELHSRHSRNTLEQAGMRAGVDVKFTFETPFRERDLLVTQASTGDRVGSHSGVLGGPLSLDKIMYTAQLTEELSVKVAPLGAVGSDITEQTLNPLQGQGLTRFSSGGVALFQECKGTAAAVTLRNSSGVSLTAAQFLGGWGDQLGDVLDASSTEGPLCASTLANITMQPHNRLLLSFSALNRFWPTPPLPTNSGLHWSEMGPLVIPKLWPSKSAAAATSPQQASPPACQIGSSLVPAAAACEPDSLLTKGTAMQSLAMAGAIDLVGRATLAAWAQIERADWLQENEKKKLQWAIVMARSPSSAGRFSWGLSVGASQPDMWRPVPSDGMGRVGEAAEEVAEQLQMEGFLRINCGKGFTIQPGVVFVTDNPFSGGKVSSTPAWMLRSSWNI